MTGNTADAQDATQEALLAIVRGLPRFDSRSSFATWSFRVATNACLDELRRRRRRPSPADLDAAPPSADLEASSTADAVVARFTVDEALHHIPLEFRTAVVLRDLCGLDYAEIAEVLDIPPGTVRSRIARGRSLLADRIGNPSTPPERQNPEQ